MSQTKEKTYQTGYGLLRILACFSVVLHHFLTSNQTYIDTLQDRWLFDLADNFLMCCNGLFFMLSGKFALENYRGDIKAYYMDKLNKIGLPFLLMSAYYYLAHSLESVMQFNPVEFIRALLGNNILGYLWFVYVLAGFYLVVPFLAPAMQKMTKKNARITLIMLLVLLLFRNVCEIFGQPFIFVDFPFFSMLFILMGYLIDHIDMSSKEELFLYGASLASMAASGYQILFLKGWNPSLLDDCPSRVIMCLGFFVLISRHTDKLTGFCRRQIKWMGGYTYYIYLIHCLGQVFFYNHMWDVWFTLMKLHFLAALFLGAVIIFIISLIFAVLLDWSAKGIKYALSGIAAVIIDRAGKGKQREGQF